MSEEFIPFPAYYDDAPIDLRWVFADERPAGKHGFLKAAGDHFEFEDGTAGRFWGTNFNGGACFPDREHAVKTALRLAKTGCNIVRFHQLDAEWNTPNIFNFTKGPRCASTTEFDPESMDALDYFIWQLKENGIYCYMDIFTYRRFKTEDGVAAATELKDAGKPYSGYDRRMIELQKKLAYDMWNHYNPYTGLSYKNDPVFVMGEVVNESDLFYFKLETEPYVNEFRSMYRDWLTEKGINGIDAASCDVNDNTGAMRDFKIFMQEKYYTEMITFMRETGVKIPLTGSTWATCDEMTLSQRVTDYTDNHHYFYDWRWEEHRCMNTATTQVDDCGFWHLSKLRYFDMPMFVSEWDMPWPNEFRAESPILFSAVGSMQNWSGFAIHTYAYSNRLDRMNILGKETSGTAIGGVAYREGIYSTWNDPAKFGLFYHAALITRRRDVTGEGMKKITVKLGKNSQKALHCISEKYLVGVQAGEETLADEVFDEEDVIIDPACGEVSSGNGQLYRNWKNNYGYIDTDRTKCLYGFLGKNGKKEISGLTVDCKSDFAVIAFSSLRNTVLRDTDTILLSAVGRAQNTDAVFDGDLMVKYGHAPVQAQVIKADIELDTVRPNMVVWAVNPEGMYVGRLPSVYEGGKLKFTLGDKFKSIYYMIVAE